MKKLLLNAFAIGALLAGSHAWGQDDQDCYGRTQTPGGWGSPANGNNPGSYRDEYFDEAFPNGVTVGCSDGSITLTSEEVVEEYLPCGGTPETISGNTTDPECEGNNLVNHLIALSLSIGFDNYDPSFSESDIALEDQLIASGQFEGWTVAEFMDIANDVLGGCNDDYTANEIKDVAASINENYTDGDSNNGFLECSQSSSICEFNPPPTVSGTEELTVECGEAIPDMDPVFEDNDDLIVSFEWDSIPGECGYTLIRSWTAIDICDQSVSFTQTITVQDTTDPVLSSFPGDLQLECNDVLPGAAIITASDACDDNVTVTFTEESIDGSSGEPDDVILVTDLLTPDMAGTEWSVVLNDMGGDVMHLLTTEGQMMVWEDEGDGQTAHITATLVDAENPGGGFTLDLWLNNGVDWAAWDNMPFSTSYKDDLGLAGDNYLDWFYYIISSTSTLTGWGDYAGSVLSIEHAPESHLYGYQVGVAANNVNSNDGSGGWFFYTGSFSENGNTIEVEGAGDIAFDNEDDSGTGNDACGPVIVRTWTATDCSGNSVSHTQHIYISDTTGPQIFNIPSDITIECGADTNAPGNVFAEDACGTVVSLDYIQEIATDDSCAYHITRTWTATDECGNITEAGYTIHVTDTEAPVLSSMPEDIELSCGEELPAIPTISANDECEGIVDVDFTEMMETDSTNSTNEMVDVLLTSMDLVTPDMPGSQWSLSLLSIPMDFVTTSAHIDVWEDEGEGRTAHITAEFVNPENTDGGLIMDLWLENGLNWDNWITQDFETGYKDDLGLAGDHYLDWYYYLISSSSALTGWGDYEGTYLDISHAPMNHFYGYQVGVAANNVNANDGNGGWINYEGTFVDSSTGMDEFVQGAGDIAFDNGLETGVGNVICINTVTRTWTATDCAGNTVSHTQTITITNGGDITISNVPDDMWIECGETIPVVPTNVVAVDECDAEHTLQFNEEIIPDSCTQQIVRTWTVTDDCGNSAEASYTIYVTDSLAPVFSMLPEDMDLPCGSEFPAADTLTALDNCTDNIDVIFTEQLNTDSNGVQVSTRTWTAIDCSGNTVEHTQTLTIHIDGGDLVIINAPADTMIMCTDQLPVAPLNVYAENVNGDVFEVEFSEVMSDDTCLYHVVRTWSISDLCGNTASATQTINVIDTIAPVLSAMPEFITLECGSTLPDAPVITATDDCSGNVIVSYTEILVEDTIGNSNNVNNTPLYSFDLLTAQSPGTDWSLILESMPGGPMLFTTVSAHIDVYPDAGEGRSAHITATFVDINNAEAGFSLDMWLHSGIDWDAWSNQVWPTSYKDDAAVAGNNYLDWYYYIIDNTSVLAGWGDYEGSVLNLSHAPASMFYGYQIGVASNNVNANDGNGGWFFYDGVFFDSSTGLEAVVNGAGDVAFDNGEETAVGNELCADPTVLRTWTATDCSGNSVSYTQVIDFVDPADSTEVQVSNPGPTIINAFPNPATDHTTIVAHSRTDSQVVIDITSPTGDQVTQVFRGTILADQPLNIETALRLTSGLYHITMTDQFGNRASTRLVVN